MMNSVNFPRLALQTLRDPKSAAAQIMSWQLDRTTLWSLAILIIICTTLVSYFSHALMPVPEPYASLVEQPWRLFGIMAGVFVVSIYVLFWVGRSLGGSGEITDLLALLVWLQVLRAVAQIIVLLAVLISPLISALLVLFTLIATVWVFVNFVSAGLQLNSLLRAIMVCVFTLIAIIFMITLIGPMIGLNALGVPAHV